MTDAPVPARRWPVRDPVGGDYACILADPPWRFQTRSEKGVGARSADAHYPTMSLADIAGLPVADVCAKDAWLFLWTTWPHLPQALGVIDAWGFTYSGSGFVWCKTTKYGKLFTGLGYTTRKNTEPCLLARRGSPRRLSKAVHEVIIAPVREHSRKPSESHRRIEAFCPGPRLEMFSRESRSGWDSWGLETDRFASCAVQISSGTEDEQMQTGKKSVDEPEA